jgi:hypothetical protein
VDGAHPIGREQFAYALGSGIGTRYDVRTTIDCVAEHSAGSLYISCGIAWTA